MTYSHFGSIYYIYNSAKKTYESERHDHSTRYSEFCPHCDKKLSNAEIADAARWSNMRRVSRNHLDEITWSRKGR